MGIFFTLLLVAILAGLLWLVHRYTDNGTVPLREAVSKTTVWISAAGVAFGQFIADALALLAQNWSAVEGQYASLFTNEALGPFLQVISGIFFFWRLKRQGDGLRLKFPPIDPTDQAGA